MLRVVADVIPRDRHHVIDHIEIVIDEFGTVGPGVAASSDVPRVSTSAQNGAMLDCESRR